MKKYFIAATIICFIISCGSCKSKTGEAAANKTDTATNNPPNNVDQLKQTDLNKIGELSIGMSMAAVIEKLGQPEARSKAEEWGADGLLHQDWEYKTKGISLNMSSKGEATAMEVFQSALRGPALLKQIKKLVLVIVMMK